LQREAFDRERVHLDLAKYEHLNDRLKNDMKKSKQENFMLTQKLDISRRAMYDYDMQ